MVTRVQYLYTCMPWCSMLLKRLTKASTNAVLQQMKQVVAYQLQLALQVFGMCYNSYTFKFNNMIVDNKNIAIKLQRDFTFYVSSYCYS